MARRMLALEKWGEGRNPLLTAFAYQVVKGAESCYETCVMARQGKRIDGAALPLPVEAWKWFYRDEPGLLRAVTGRLYGGMPGAEDMQEWLDFKEGIEQLQAMAPKDRRDAVEAALADLGVTDMQGLVALGRAKAKEMSEAFAADLREEVKQSKQKEVAPAPPGAAEALGSPETLFFFRVWLPCWLEYGVKLPVLLDKAQAGGINALDMLLRLDKTALDLPEIRRQYLAFVDNKPVFERLTKALSGPPLRRLTLQKVKVNLGALVFKMFAEMDKGHREMERRYPSVRYAPVKLTAPDVQALFDAAAQDLRGVQRDLDLPPGDHAFYMALRREERFWDSLG